MNEILEKIEELTLSMGRLTSQIQLMDFVIEQIIYNDEPSLDDGVIMKKHVDMLWDFSSELVKFAEKREEEVDAVYNEIMEFVRKKRRKA